MSSSGNKNGKLIGGAIERNTKIIKQMAEYICRYGLASLHESFSNLSPRIHVMI